jgi:putative sugar O-methyltransferase
MKTDLLEKIIRSYKNAPKEFQATRYWDSKESSILQAIKNIEPGELRSGKYRILETFGFCESVFHKISKSRLKIKIILSLIWKVLFRGRTYLAYSVDLSDIREMAYHHCELLGELSKAKPISSMQTSKFGNPEDLFKINGNEYSMQFLSYYIRYCFVQKHISLNGQEIIVELGSGSGHQIEVLKKLYPELTILCFDLPPQIYLCELYLTNVFGKDNVVSIEETLNWTDLSKLKKGKIHFMGNWQIPVLQNFKFDIFWNAASFGEMEPHVVENYLSYILMNCTWVYLLQIREGNPIKSVNHPVVYDDYNRWLKNFTLIDQHDAYKAHKRLTENRGYFEAIWKFKN